MFDYVQYEATVPMDWRHGAMLLLPSWSDHDASRKGTLQLPTRISGMTLTVTDADD